MKQFVFRVGIIALLVGGFWWYGSSYIVTYRAAQLAGDRPYCLSVSGDKIYTYDEVRSRYQLAFAHMWAGWSESGGSRGAYQSTNHALLILVDPPTVMNWSYKAENFVSEPMLNNTYDRIQGRRLASSGEKSCTPTRSFVGTLGW